MSITRDRILGLDEAEATIVRIAGQGQDPRAYRRGLADACRVAVETIDAIIARHQMATGDDRISAEDAAQQTLARQRQERRADPAAARLAEHEED